MILIGENIHIISKKVKEALEKKDENFVKNLIKIQEKMNCIDLNVGPAKGKLDKIFEWLCPLVEGQNISFDSSNFDAIESGLKLLHNCTNCFINSSTADNDKLSRFSDLAMKYNCNLIILAMKREIGIPKSAEGRMEHIFEAYEKCIEKGMDSQKIFFDPLVLPIKVDNTQAIEALNTIKMVNESFDPKANTIIGLSNISNGVPQEIRPLINRVYCAMALGAGLNSAIVDAKDFELQRIINIIENKKPNSSTDELYIKIANAIENFEEIEEISFDKNDIEQENIIKTTAILSGKKIYSDSFAQV